MDVQTEVGYSRIARMLLPIREPRYKFSHSNWDKGAAAITFLELFMCLGKEQWCVIMKLELVFLWSWQKLAAGEYSLHENKNIMVAKGILELEEKTKLLEYC